MALCAITSNIFSVATAFFFRKFCFPREQVKSGNDNIFFFPLFFFILFLPTSIFHLEAFQEHPKLLKGENLFKSTILYCEIKNNYQQCKFKIKLKGITSKWFLLTRQ